MELDSGSVQRVNKVKQGNPGKSDQEVKLESTTGKDHRLFFYPFEEHVSLCGDVFPLYMNRPLPHINERK